MDIGRDKRGLIDRDRQVIWHPYTQHRIAPEPLGIVRGEGVWLYTEDGRKILDGISSWWVNIHGHSHPKLNAALAAQAQELEHVIFAGCTHRPAVELAERLLAVLPRGLSRVFYSDNGSTAVEAALKMAHQYWVNRGEERQRIVALEGAYHGDTVGAMSASARSVFTQAFEPLLFEVARAGSLEDIERLLREAPTAAVIVEPMLQGATGMIVWPAEFVAGVRRLCDEYGALMIADEVLTGFGRTGRMFACEHSAYTLGGVTPDIVCLSKALTGGYLPLGATVVTERVYEAFLSDDRAKTFFHGHSYTANPLACAVGIASLDLFAEEGTMERVAGLETQLRAASGQWRPFGSVRGIGGVIAVELEGAGYLDGIGPRLGAAFLERGILLRPLGNVVYFMPPYCISSDEAEWALAVITSTLCDFVKGV